MDQSCQEMKGCKEMKMALADVIRTVILSPSNGLTAPNLWLQRGLITGLAFFFLEDQWCEAEHVGSLSRGENKLHMWCDAMFCA